MKPCKACNLEDLADLRADRLAADRADELRRHLARCPTCRRAADRLTRLADALLRAEALAERDVPQADHRRIMASAAQGLARKNITRGFFRRPALRRAMAMAAAAVFIVGAIFFLKRAADSPLGLEVARAVAVRGTVFAAGDERAAIGPQDRLRIGQRIATGRASQLSITMIGGEEIELNENTSLALQSSAGGSTVCRLDQGQVYVKLNPADRTRVMVLRTPVGRIEAVTAEFDLYVAPRAVASWWRGRAAGPLMLAAAPAVMGAVGPPAEVRLTVISGEAILYVNGDPIPVTVRANQQVRYDPESGKPAPQKVRPERYVLWRLSDEEVFRLAQQHLVQLFAGQVEVLPGRRVRLDYDFLTSREMTDWQVVGNQWMLYLNALRYREGDGPGQIISRAAFVGDLEVEFGVTVDLQREATFGWQFRPVSDGADAAVTASAKLAIDKEPELNLSLTFDGQGRPGMAARLPGQQFRFGGRLEGDSAYLSLAGDDVIEAPVPDEMLRRLHDKENPEATRVVVRAGGADLFIANLTVTGRPDPRWLRTRLKQIFQNLDHQD
ncbi:MAG: hypothetical protein GWP05_01675 [Anaerolineaceae bacterium]|nr:hypothetical protein [Anaerolineaceae bacterium]